MRQVLVLASVLAVSCAPVPEVRDPPAAAPPAVPPAITEGFVLSQLSPPMDRHGEVRWPQDGDVARFTYRIVPRRSGREGDWGVADADRVRGVVLVPPQERRGRLTPLDDTTIVGDRLVAPEGWTVTRSEWMGGEVLWFRAEEGHLPAEGAEFGLEMDRGEGWPNALSGTYACGVALTDDGELPTADDGTPAYLGNLVGPVRSSNVVWWWFRQEREAPADGLSDPAPISVPIRAR